MAFVVRLTPPDIQPCHPGCFPAGTLIATPKDAKPIDILRAGDFVLSVLPDGRTTPVAVQSVFVTYNRLLKIETEDGELLTTQTQPLCLENGEIRTAEELKPGDRVFRWENGKRCAVRVRALKLTGREEKVFNLVLGDMELFIANGFVVRSKPPHDAVTATPALNASTPADCARR
ncbi:MAG: Hint domain-containing protein [Gemmataceae bacterium]|nr:Hint domain-containing protein [Gemmataceae bacterium]MCI0741740.1 Hint domain-containing protein [Gemmataceae bacterium]